MKILLGLTVVLGGLALCAGAPSFAQTAYMPPGIVSHRDDNSKTVTPEQKQASDQLMQSGLSDLQSASNYLGQNDSTDALTALRTAYKTMDSAEPIYHGYRDHSMDETKEAGRILDNNKKNAVSRAGEHLTTAITDAQTAVQNY